MANVHYFTQNYDVLYGGYAVSVGQSTLSFSKWADAKNYDIIVGLAAGTNVASGSVVTMKAYQASTSTGSGSKTVTGATWTYTAGAASTYIIACQVRGQDLDVANGFEYVSFVVTTGNGSGVETGTGIVLGGRARYKQATVPAM